MPHSQPSSADRSPTAGPATTSSASARAALASLGPAVIVLGVLALGFAAERHAYEWSDVRHWLPDIVVGIVFAAAGAVALARRFAVGVLFVATGYAWFLGNFWVDLTYVHRGPLVHALVTYAALRSRSTSANVVAVAGYVAAFVTPVWRSDLAGGPLAATLVVLAIASHRSARGYRRRDRRIALQATAAFALAVTGGVIVRALVPARDAIEPMLLVYEAALCWIAITLASRLRRLASTAVSDLVVELGESPPRALETALAATLGDPTLRVGFWSGTRGYVDAEGAVLELPADHAGAATTFVERDSRPFAVLVHDPAVLDEPALVAAVAAATRLVAAHGALADEVRHQIAELTDSRRRLVVAADEERRRLEARLRSGVESHVESLAGHVERLAERPDASGHDHLRRAGDHLSHTLVDLRRLAQGLHPRELESGLHDALEALVLRSTVPATLSCHLTSDVLDDVASAAFFVCAEALANVAKHSGARRVDVRVDVAEGRVRVSIADDGCGGADTSVGSGLRGLVDRVEAMGGALTVSSPTSGGTLLAADFPFITGT